MSQASGEGADPAPEVDPVAAKKAKAAEEKARANEIKKMLKALKNKDMEKKADGLEYCRVNFDFVSNNGGLELLMLALTKPKQKAALKGALSVLTEYLCVEDNARLLLAKGAEISSNEGDDTVAPMPTHPWTGGDLFVPLFMTHKEEEVRVASLQCFALLTRAADAEGMDALAKEGGAMESLLQILNPKPKPSKKDKEGKKKKKKKADGDAPPPPVPVQFNMMTKLALYSLRNILKKCSAWRNLFISSPEAPIKRLERVLCDGLKADDASVDAAAPPANAPASDGEYANVYANASTKECLRSTFEPEKIKMAIIGDASAILCCLSEDVDGREALWAVQGSTLQEEISAPPTEGQGGDTATGGNGESLAGGSGDTVVAAHTHESLLLGVVEHLSTIVGGWNAAALTDAPLVEALSVQVCMCLLQTLARLVCTKTNVVKPLFDRIAIPLTHLLKLKYSSVLEPLLSVAVEFIGRLTGLESGATFKSYLCNNGAVTSITNWLIDYTPREEGTATSLFRRACAKAVGLLLAEKAPDQKFYVDANAYIQDKDPEIGPNWLQVEDIEKGFASSDAEAKYWILHICQFSLGNEDFLNAVGPSVAAPLIEMLDQAVAKMAELKTGMLGALSTEASENCCKDVTALLASEYKEGKASIDVSIQAMLAARCVAQLSVNKMCLIIFNGPLEESNADSEEQSSEVLQKMKEGSIACALVKALHFGPTTEEEYTILEEPSALEFVPLYNMLWEGGDSVAFPKVECIPDSVNLRATVTNALTRLCSGAEVFSTPPEEVEDGASGGQEETDEALAERTVMEGISLSVVKACGLYLSVLSRTPTKTVRLSLIKLLSRIPGAGNGQGLEHALKYEGWVIENLKPTPVDTTMEEGGEGGGEAAGEKPVEDDDGQDEVDALGERGIFDVTATASPDSAFVKFARPFLQTLCKADASADVDEIIAVVSLIKSFVNVENIDESRLKLCDLMTSAFVQCHGLVISTALMKSSQLYEIVKPLVYHFIALADNIMRYISEPAEDGTTALPSDTECAGFKSMWATYIGMVGDYEAFGVKSAAPLTVAICGGFETIVNHLLGAGANPNYIDQRTGMSPLMLAIATGQTGLVSMLLDHEASVDTMSSEGDPVLKFAFAVPPKDTFMTVGRPATSVEESDNKVVWEAKPDLEILTLLLEAEADTNVSDDKGNFALHWAATTVSYTLLLFKSSCAVSSSPVDKEVLAVDAEIDLPLVDLLVDFQANVNACNLQGRTPLHEAILQGFDSMAVLLLRNGSAHPNVKDIYGCLPLHYACLGIGVNSPLLPPLLLDCGSGKAIRKGEHKDARKGKTKTEKLILSIEEMMKASMNEVISPAVICERAVTMDELMSVEGPQGSVAYLYCLVPPFDCQELQGRRADIIQSPEMSSRRLGILQNLKESFVKDSTEYEDAIARFKVKGSNVFHIAAMCGTPTEHLEYLNKNKSLQGEKMASLLGETDEECRLPLHYAVANSDAAAEKVINLQGESIESVVPPGASATSVAHLAAYRGASSSLTKQLLDMLPIGSREVLNCVAPGHWNSNIAGTPLILAASQGHLPTVTAFCERAKTKGDLDIDFVYESETGAYSALQLACRAGHFEVARCLVDNGASCLGVVSPLKDTLSCMCQDSEKLSMLKYILESMKALKSDEEKSSSVIVAESDLIMMEEMAMGFVDAGEECAGQGEECVQLALAMAEPGDGISHAHECYSRGEMYSVFKANAEANTKRKRLRLVVAGPPAAGKGTLCEKIVEEFQPVHLSTGDMLRSAISLGTELGKEVKDVMEQGLLVPDELVIKAVLERLSLPDIEENGFILDGFPRTANQAQALKDAGISIDTFMLIEVPEDALIKRVTGRRIDPVTGNSYHIEVRPPPPGEIADRCIQRPDDTEDSLVIRLESYNENIRNIRSFYADNTTIIEGNQAPAQVWESTKAALEELVCNR